MNWNKLCKSSKFKESDHHRSLIIYDYLDSVLGSTATRHYIGGVYILRIKLIIYNNTYTIFNYA